MAEAGLLDLVAVGLRVGPPAAGLAAVLAGAAHRRRLRSRHRDGPGVAWWSSAPSPARGDPEALVTAAAALARALRGGAALAEAIVDVGSGPDGRAVRGLAELSGRIRAGESVAVAVSAWSAKRRDPGARLLAAALLVSATTGGATAATLDGVTTGLVAEWEAALELRAATSQARASAAVLVALPPAAALVLGAVGGAGPGVWLSPLGVVCLVVGGVLEAAGIVWMRTLVHRALRPGVA